MRWLTPACSQSISSQSYKRRQGKRFGIGKTVRAEVVRHVEGFALDKVKAAKWLASRQYINISRNRLYRAIYDWSSGNVVRTAKFRP